MLAEKCTTAATPTNLASSRLSSVGDEHNLLWGAGGAEAAGVLALHKEHLKKQTHISNHEFDEISQMLDDEEEPDMHHPLKHAYWNIRQNFDRFLKREMYIGDDPTAAFELNLPTKRKDWPHDDADRFQRRRQDAVPDGPDASVLKGDARLGQALHNLAEP